MNRADLGLVLGLAGFLLGGWALVVSLGAGKKADDFRGSEENAHEMIESLGARVEALDQSHKDLTQRVSRLSSDPNALWDAVHDLQSRMEVVEAKIGIERKKK